MTYKPHAPKYISYDELKEKRPDLARLWEYHPDEAKNLLAEAGYPDGFDAVILTHHDMPHWVEPMQGYLNDFGIRAEVKGLEEIEGDEMAKKLEGKVAIVTGGSRGIGESISKVLAREGAKVALLARNKDKGRAVQEEIRSADGDATFITCDITDHQSVEAAVAQTVETYGGVHVLVNNAGGGGVITNISSGTAFAGFTKKFVEITKGFDVSGAIMEIGGGRRALLS